MKTPRDILLARHAGAAPELDAIRERLVAGMARDSDPRRIGSFVEFLISLRWHTAAMSALWLLAAALGGEPARVPDGPVASSAATLPPAAYIFALREYELEFEEVDNPAPDTAPPPVPHACIRPRHDEDCENIA